MLQRKPNPALQQAIIDSQPKSTIYKPHPKKKGVMQRFTPTFSVDEEAVRSVILGKPEASFIPCEGNEKPDAMIYSLELEKVIGYKKC